MRTFPASICFGLIASISLPFVTPGTAAGQGPNVVVVPLFKTTLNWQGAWKTGTVYSTLAAIEYGGSSYICKQSHTAGAANQPPNATYWDVLAAEGLQGADGPTGPDGSIAGGSGAFIYNDNGVPGAADMYYNSISGFIGIGTSAPQYELDVVGDVNATGFTGDGSGLTGVTGATGDTVNSGSTTIGADSNSDGSGEIFLQTQNSTRVTVANNGNVGIGTVNPTSLLDVAGVVNATGMTIGGTPLCSSTGTYWTESSGDLYAMQDAIVNGSFSVGSGSTPGRTFDFDTLIVADDNPRLLFDDTSISASFPKNDWRIIVNDLDGNGSANYFAINDVTASSIPLKIEAEAPSNSLYIQSVTGNVGIGTDSPQGKLDVNGPIYQRGGQLYADYVFEPDYQLESIEEHAEYMWRERHLPKVPKVRHDEQGREILELGAHTRGMLEELEKAHIYIQQLHNDGKGLEQRLNTIEATLARLQQN